MRVLQEMRKCHLAGASPVQQVQPGRLVASLAATVATPSPMRRHASERATCSHPRNVEVLSANGVSGPEATATATTHWHIVASHSAGTWSVVRTKEMTQEPGIPIHSVEHRRPEARETAAEAACAMGVGGLGTSEDAGERMTPDPAEQSEPASGRTSGGNHARR